MKTNNKNSKFNIIAKKAIFMSGAIALSLGVIALNFTKEDPYFSKYRTNYDSDLAYIKNATVPSVTNHVTISEVAEHQDVDYSSKVITIENALELKEFSTLCNSSSKDTFLDYDYILIDNIDADSINGFNPIGWDTGHEFTGTFNGQGYEISNLDLIVNQSATFTGTYYSMFGINKGEISNLGLKYPTLTISGTATNIGNGGVSYLVGLNDTGATVDHCFVIDDGYVLDSQKATMTEEESKNRSGITAPEQRISSFCVNNKGSLTNNYVAVGVVADIQYQFAEMAEIALSNSGTINNCFYYNKSILAVSGGTVNFRDNYNIESRPVSLYGTRCDTANSLISSLSSNGYFTKTKYGTLGSYTGVKYGIMRGMEYDDTTKTFTVVDAYDFAYMFELFNTDAHLAADNVSFKITNDIDLSVVPVTSYSYNKGIGATIYGDTLSDTTVTMIDNNPSVYPTIYNADVMNPARIAKNVGVDCYGLFNFVTGKISNLNVYTTTMDLANVDITDLESDDPDAANIKGIGALCGYVEQGEIDGVNVFANVTNTSSDSIGEYYLGGITGILGGNGVIKNSTAAGSINIGSKTNSVQTNSFMSGIAVGGIVGYIESSSGNVYNCTNAMNITLGLGSDITYAVGGVIGAGYTTSHPFTVSSTTGTVEQPGKTSNLENVGNITVGTNGSSTYNELYVSGVLGRHLGMTAQVESFNNYGNITVYSNTAKKTYVSGVSNADIKTTSNNGLKASEFINTAGQYLYYASGFANGGEVVVNTSANSNNLYYTNVLNIKASNGFISKVDGLFNLAYYSKYNEASSTENLKKTKTAINAQEINMNKFYTFAPVANVIGGTSAYTTELGSAYNLRDIDYTLATAISSATTFNYTGCVLGDYIAYNDIRNEGNLSFSFEAGISTQSTLKVSGLFDTLNNGHTAASLYNGGDITINETDDSADNKKIDMYLSGICYDNQSVDDSDEQNPLDADFDESLTGTIDTVINDGKITVKSDYLVEDTRIDQTPSTTPHFVSNLYIGGITYKNSGIIANAFNLGNIDVAIYTLSGNTGKYYEAGGITCLMDGAYAQIRDAANNGDIYVIDITNKSYKSTVNIGGIIARNCLQDRTASAGNNNKQVVAFTINYGTLNAFQSAANMSEDTSTVAGCHTSAGAILGVGICNLVDIVNYGNVYSSECSAGIVSLVRLGTYSSSNTINLANTINYGQVKINPIYYATLEQAINYQTYSSIYSLINCEDGAVGKRTYTGSICTIFDFNSQKNINVRYLINLYSQATTVLFNLNLPSTSPDVTTFITVASTTDKFGVDNNSTNYITYSPLSTIEDENGNYGVFSSKFVFRRAINKDNVVYKPETYLTDKYIPEFFQFVSFDKVNSVLLESIGWQSIAYQNAAEELVKNVNALASLITESNALTNNSINVLLDDAFTGNTWLSTMNDDLFDSLLNTSLESSELSSNITTILNYVLFDSTALSSYTNTIRSKIVDVILGYYENQYQEDINYYELLQSTLYDVLLAKVVSNYDTNYTAVRAKIVDILDDENVDLSTVFDSYISLLQSNNSILAPLFNNDTKTYYENPKIDLLYVLLNGYDEVSLKKIYDTLETTSTNLALQYKLYLMNNGTQATDIYKKMIEFNSLSTNQSYLSFINSILSKYDFNSIITSPVNDTYVNDAIGTFNDISSITGYKYTELNGIYHDKTQKINTIASQLKTIQNLQAKNITSLNITPDKDYSSLWNVIKEDTQIQDYISENYFTYFKNPTSGQISRGIIAHATEWNNTYQTNDRSMLSYGISDSSNYHSGIAINDDYYGGGQANFTGDNNDVYSNNRLNYPIKTRFIYTPDDVVSYRTNYYGPYENATSTYTSVNADGESVTFTGIPYNAGGYLTQSNRNYYLGDPLNVVNDQSVTTERRFVPFFISLDSSITSQMIAKSNPTNKNSTLYPFLFHDFRTSSAGWNNDSQWKDYQFVYDPANQSGNPDDGFIYYYYYDSDSNPLNDKNNYIMNGYSFNPEFVPTLYNDSKCIVNYDSNYDSITFAGNTYNSLINKEGNSHTYKDYYMKGYATASILTGIFITYSAMTANSINGTQGNQYVSLHAKHDKTKGAWQQDGENGYYGIHTTSFIGYTLQDLLLLDGIKTKGKCNNELDEDEINIVSAICKKLLTDNKELVIRAVARYSSENTFNSTNANVLNLLLYASQDADYAKEVITNNVSQLLSFKYSNNSTIQARLESLMSGVTSSYKDLIINSSMNHRSNFSKVLLATLNEYSIKCKLYESYNTYPRTDIMNLVYDYIGYKYNEDPNYSSTQFYNDFVTNLSDDDLVNIYELFNTDRTRLLLHNYHLKNSNEGLTYLLDDVTIVSSADSAYSSNYDSNYTRVLIGNSGDLSNDYETNSYITFTTGDLPNGYNLRVKFKGRVYLYDNDNYSTIEKDNLDEFIFENLYSDSTYTLYLDTSTELYEFELYNEEYYSSDKTYLNDVVSPFTTIGNITMEKGIYSTKDSTVYSGLSYVNKLTLIGDGEDHKYSKNLYGRSYYFNPLYGEEVENRINFSFSQSNVNYNSVTISFKLLYRNQDNEINNYPSILQSGQVTAALSFNGNSVNLNSNNVGTKNIGEQSFAELAFAFLSTDSSFGNKTYYKNENKDAFKPSDFKLYELVSSTDTLYSSSKKYCIDMVGTVATPLNSNSGNALYELVGDNYSFTTDSSFGNKTYYKDTSGTVATPINCSLYEYKLTTDTSYNSNKKYFKDSNGTVATPVGLGLYESSSTPIIDAYTNKPKYLTKKSGNRTYKVVQYTASIPLTYLQDINSYYIDINCTSHVFENSRIILTDCCVDFDYSFVNNIQTGITTNIIQHQNVFYPYNWDKNKSTVAINNTNNKCGVDVSGGYIGSYDFPGSTTVNCNENNMQTALIFKPWYNELIDEKTTFDDVMNFNLIDISTNDIKPNLDAGYYEGISQFGKFVIKDYFIKQNGTSFNTNDINSDVFFHATGNGSITILDEENEPLEVINVITDDDEYKWYKYNSTYSYAFITSGVTISEFYVTPVGTRMSYSKNASTGIDTLVANNTRTLINFDYTDLNNDGLIDSSKVSQFNSDDDILEYYNLSSATNYDKYKVFYMVYPYYRSVAGKTNTELRELDIFNSIITLMGTIRPNSYNPKLDSNSNYYTIFGHPIFNNAKWKELVQLIALADFSLNDSSDITSSALGRLINGLNSSDYVDLLKGLCDDSITGESVSYNTMLSIYDYASTHLNSNFALYVYAAYLGQDYLNSNNLLTSSIMHSILDIFDDGIEGHGAGYYQFITSNTTVNAEKVTALISYLSNNSNVIIDGFGIFALSSSHGIGYGIFIPDNMDLSKLDVLYEMDDTLNRYVLISGTTKSSKWRGGETISDGEEGSVDYAFYHDMKQLRLSISTDVFELNFNNDSIKSVDDQINNASGEIIYYVNSSTFGSIFAMDSLTISKNKLANNAILSTTTISLTGENVVKTSESITITNAFKVFAEDRAVSKSYTVKIIKLSPYGLSVELDPTTVEYSGGTITATVSGKGMVDGMDLEPYITITDNNGNTTYPTSEGYWKLDPEYANNGIVKNNTASIRLIIDKTLPGGTLKFNLDILGGTANAPFTKNKNTANNITKFGFNGELLTFTNNSVTSYVPFGRAFDYEELTNPESDRFYLYAFEYAVNANMVITATNTDIDEHGLMTYVVSFNVTAEIGGDPVTYTHIIKEKQYFTNSSIYANLYADGDVVAISNSYSTLSETQRVKYLSGGTFTYALNSDKFAGKGTEGHLNDTMLMKVSFNRGVEPQYRVKYVLDNFYTLGSNVTFGPTEATSSNLASIQNTYAGLTVTVTNNNSTGVYTFVYSYSNTGTWSGNTTYERYYEFPELVIEKLASTDALLHEITFLEEAVSLGNSATVILPNTVLIPNEDDEEGTVGYDSNDVVYNDAFTKSQYQNIKVSSRGINYTNDTDATNISDYFVIGTVSNADLSYYCPSFGINKYAQMYQYTTLEKLTHYGAGVQTDTDYEVLTNHNTMFLYVPYTNGTTKAIYLVEVDSNGYWTNVYTTKYNGENESTTKVGEYPANTVKTLTAKEASPINGYSVCDYAGNSTDNDSLFMDYVGTPVDGHFWYVSYVIFSEDKLSDGNLPGNIRYYHISLIDLTNNIQFYVTVYAKPTLNPSDLYLTIAENSYDKNGVQTKTQISAYAVNKNNEVYDNDSTEEDRDDIDGYKIYRLRYDLQSLPTGYFYFYIDLPDGYVATAHTNKVNQLIIYEDDGKTVKSRDSRYLTEAGSFLPFSSIITQKVDLEIIVDEGTGEDASAWAVATSDIYTRQAKYEGLIPA